MGVRTYVPHLGRFLQTDPVKGGSLNAYEYAGQDPCNTFDLDGRKKKKRGIPSCDGYRYRGNNVRVSVDVGANGNVYYFVEARMKLWPALYSIWAKSSADSNVHSFLQSYGPHGSFKAKFVPSGSIVTIWGNVTSFRNSTNYPGRIRCRVP